MPARAETGSNCSTCRGKGYLLEAREERAVARTCGCSRECRECGGSGYSYQNREETFSAKMGPRSYEVLVPCRCRTLRARLELYSRAEVPGVVGRADFDNYVPSSPAQDRAKKMVEGFARGYRRGEPPKGFIISGRVGNGKT